jgi:hypothetical protein
LVARGTIDRLDLGAFRLTDSLDEMAESVEQSMATNAPEWAKGPRRKAIFGER